MRPRLYITVAICLPPHTQDELPASISRRAVNNIRFCPISSLLCPKWRSHFRQGTPRTPTEDGHGLMIAAAAGDPAAAADGNRPGKRKSARGGAVSSSRATYARRKAAGEACRTEGRRRWRSGDQPVGQGRSQTSSVESREAETSIEPSGERASAVTAPWWPDHVPVRAPVARSQPAITLSAPAA